MTASAPTPSENRETDPPARDPVSGPFLARNTGFNLLGLGLPLLVALVAVPLLLRGLGPERFGLLSLAWMAIALVGEVGLGRAATRFVADAMARGRARVARRVVRTTAAAQVALGLVLGAAVGLAAPTLVGALDLPQDLVGEASLAFLIVAVILPVTMLSSLFRGVLEAHHRFDLVNLVRFAVSTATYALPVLGMWAGWGVAGIVAMLLAARSVAAVAYGVLAARLLPTTQGGEAEPPSTTPGLGVLLRFGGWVTVATLLTPLLLSVDRVLLGVFVSAAAVGIYTAPYELVLRLVLVPGSLAATLFPAFSTLQGLDRQAELSSLLARSSRYVLAAVGSAVALLAAGAEVLLSWWLGTGYTPDAALALRLLAPGVLAASLAQVPFSLLQGIGRADVPGKLYLAELPAVCLLAWLFVGRWGIGGAAAAWSARASVEAVVLFIAARRLAPSSSSSGEAGRSLATFVCLLVVGGMAWAGVGAAGASAAAVGALGLAGLLLAAVLWHVTLAPPERTSIRRSLARAVA